MLRTPSHGPLGTRPKNAQKAAGQQQQVRHGQAKRKPLVFRPRGSTTGLRLKLVAVELVHLRPPERRAEGEAW